MPDSRTARQDAEIQVDANGALLPPMPVAVTSFGAAADATHLYVVGGYFGEPHNYSREGQSRALQRVALDGSGSWEPLSELEHGLQGLAAVAHEGRLCRFGGSRADNAAGEPTRMHSVADAACFDLDDRKWHPLAPLPTGRSSHAAALIGSKVYVAGGWQLSGDPSSGRWQAKLLSLDLARPDGEWQQSDSPIERRALALAGAGERLIAIGGLTPDRELSRRVDVFDPAAGSWTRGPDFPTDAFGIAAVGIGDTVYGSARDGMIYGWSPGESSWRPVRPLAFPRFFHQLVAAQQDPASRTLVAIGGISGMHTDGRTRHVERLDLANRGVSIASFTAAYPGSAKNRQAVFLHGDFLYLFGGNNSLEQHDFEPHNFVAEGHRLHLPSMTWQRVADYPAARQSMQTAQWEGHALAIGGFGHDGKAAVTHDEAYVFDFDKERFSPRAGLPEGGRTQFGTAHEADSLWIFGGLDYDPRRKGEASFDHVTALLTAPANDPDTGFTDADIALPGPRRAFAGTAHGGKYYLIGGMRGGFELVDDCQAFDFASRAFSPLPCPRAPRLSARLLSLGEHLYLVGGSVQGPDGIVTDRSIEVFDPNTAAWSLLVDELPFDTRHAHTLVYGSQLLIVSTHRTDARILVALVSPVPEV